MFQAILLALSLISLRVSPATCWEPCDIHLKLTVERAPDNQKVVIEFEADDSPFYRKTELDYTGKVQRTIDLTYHGFPRGTYIVRVTLWKHDGKSWVAGSDSRTVRVQGPNDTP